MYRHTDSLFDFEVCKLKMLKGKVYIGSRLTHLMYAWKTMADRKRDVLMKSYERERAAEV